MIKNILFDLGGVIVTLDSAQAVARFVEIGLKDAARRLDTYTQSGIFGELEQGVIDAEQFRAGLGELTGREVTADECRYAWNGYVKEVPPRNLDALLRLRGDGYRVVLVSNTNPFMMDWALSDAFDGHGHPLSYYMDSMYMSYRLGVMKPNADFFRRVIASEGINPKETLFLDDGKRNVEMAAQFGMQTFCPVNGADWTQDIYGYLK